MVGAYRFFLDDDVDASELMTPQLRGRLAAMERPLKHPTGRFKAKAERALRGSLLEFLMEQALGKIAEDTCPNGVYRIEPAPVDIFDASTDQYKGGDLLLVQALPGEERIIALIDATTHKSTTKLRSGMNRVVYRDKEVVVPVVIVEMEGVKWVDRETAKTMETQWYLHTVVRRSVRENTHYKEVLYGLEPTALAATLAQVRERFSAGVVATREHIEGNRYREEGLKEILLFQLQQADDVLGIMQS